MGKRIVIAAFGSFEDVNPCVGLALGLKQRGHSPVIATAEFYRSYVQSEGLDFHSVRPDVNPRDEEVMRRVMDPKRGTEYLYQGVSVPTREGVVQGLVGGRTGC